MKKIFFTFLGFIFSTQISFAAEQDAGVLSGIGVNAQKKIREGDIHIGDIPKIIVGAIDFFMGFAATISLIFIIIGAYQMLFGSVFDQKSKGKETIIMAISGLALASLSWLIIKLIIDNFS